MQIISGLNQDYKRHQIIQKYVQEAQNHPFEQYKLLKNKRYII